MTQAQFDQRRYMPCEPTQDDHDHYDTQEESFGLAALGSSLGSSPRMRARAALSKPIAIPASDTKVGSPFLRAYPIELSQFGISHESFLAFLDRLNSVSAGNPPLKALGIAGGIVSLVPMATAQVVGTAVRVGANVGTAVVSKGRTEIFMREANRDLFGPRGLELHIARLDALAKLTGMPLFDANGNAMRFGRGASILGALDHTDGNWLNAQERRLQALEPYTSPLELAPQAAPTTTFGKIGGFFNDMKDMRSDRKLVKQRNRTSKKQHKFERVTGQPGARNNLRDKEENAAHRIKFVFITQKLVGQDIRH